MKYSQNLRVDNADWKSIAGKCACFTSADIVAFLKEVRIQAFHKQLTELKQDGAAQKQHAPPSCSSHDFLELLDNF